MSKSLLKVSLFLLGIYMFSGDILASVAVSPTLQEITLLPQEESSSFELTISNDSDHKQSFSILVLDFKSLDDTGGVAFAGEGERLDKYGLANWARPEKNNLVLEANAEAAIRILIDNRPDLAPGGHYGAVIVRTAEGASGQVRVRPATASLMLVRKVGGEKPALALENINASGGLFRLPVSTEIRLRASGNVHVVPRGVVGLTDPRGREVARGVINEQSGFILPESLRRFAVDLKPTAKSVWPGWYTVRVDYRYEGQDNFMTATSRVFYLGADSISIITVGLITLAVIIWQRRKLIGPVRRLLLRLSLPQP